MNFHTISTIFAKPSPINPIELDQPVYRNNLGENAAWPPTAFEPMHRNRFLVILPDMFNYPQPYFIKSITRPRYTIDDGWSDIHLTMMECIGPPIAHYTMDLITYCENNRLPDDATRDDNPLFEFQIQMLGPVGDVVSQWTIKVKNLEEAEWDALHSSSDELSLIHLDFSVLACVLDF